jgi:hypothetical protein
MRFNNGNVWSSNYSMCAISSAIVSFAQVTFFVDKDCKGTSESYRSNGETYPSDVSTDGMDMITSLIVYSRNVFDRDKTITFCQGSTELVTVATIKAQKGF